MPTNNLLCRGTYVAVKRVLPPDHDDVQPDVSSRAFSSRIVFEAPRNIAPSKHLTQDTFESRRSRTALDWKQGASSRCIPKRITKGRGYAKLKANLIAEMKCLSRLRHPNITTVMVCRFPLDLTSADKLVLSAILRVPSLKELLRCL